MPHDLSRFVFLGFSVLWTSVVGSALVRALVGKRSGRTLRVPGTVVSYGIPGQVSKPVVRFQVGESAPRQFAMASPNQPPPGTEVTVLVNPHDHYDACVEGAKGDRRGVGIAILSCMVLFGLVFCFVGSLIAFGWWLG